ncbi:MAG: hypothetical protein IPO39_12915 [Bacteroidetes bacterium]|nr:hypothetical protein [Bacteroidota bacterium]
MKKLSVVGTLFITILLMVQFPHWMLSPGEVIEGHQNIKINVLNAIKPSVELIPKNAFPVTNWIP